MECKLVCGSVVVGGGLGVVEGVGRLCLTQF